MAPKYKIWWRRSTEKEDPKMRLASLRAVQRIIYPSNDDCLVHGLDRTYHGSEGDELGFARKLQLSVQASCVTRAASRSDESGTLLGTSACSFSVSEQHESVIGNLSTPAYLGFPQFS